MASAENEANVQRNEEGTRPGGCGKKKLCCLGKVGLQKFQQEDEETVAGNQIQVVISTGLLQRGGDVLSQIE